jgi:hypothetical protein
VNADPWQHHFESDNYQPVAGMEHGLFKKLVEQHGHVKLATKLPVEAWQQADVFLYENWKQYLEMLNLTPGPSPAKL